MKNNWFNKLKKIILNENTSLNLSENLCLGYEEYLNKPKEHHDEVIKRMYRNTKYADEDPDTLRKILKKQIAS